MRARNLKPSLFKNELLAVADPLYTVIFEGLWCLADREGRLEDRPAKIHFDINPGRAFETTDRSLCWLNDNGFILRYRVGKSEYIQVVTFKEHQNPHQKEPPSKIPAPIITADMSDASPVLAPDKTDASTDPARLIPSSLIPESPFPIPDSPLPGAPGAPVARRARKPTGEPAEFAEVRHLYPKRSGSQRWDDAVRFYLRRLAEGHSHETIIAGIKRYTAWAEAAGKVGTEGIQQAATFLGDNKGFLEPWAMPRAPPAQLSPVDRVKLANGVNRDERVVSEQGGSSFGGLDSLDRDVREPFHTGFRRLGS